jgi:hypothetical protein
LGNEIYYCIQCGVRVRAAQLAEEGDGARCAPCQGIEIRKDFVPASNETSKRIRRVSSSSLIPLRRPPSGTATAVSPRPRGTDRRPRKTGRVALFGGISLLTVAVAALAAFNKTPAPAPVESRPATPVVAVPAAPAPQSPPAPAVEPPPDPLRAEFLRQLDGLKEQAGKPADPEKGDEMLDLLEDAVRVSARLAPERRAELLDWQKVFRARYEALADERYDSISEAVTGLAGEGRTADALATLQTFPKGLRRSRAWTRLEALERQVQGPK